MSGAPISISFGTESSPGRYGPEAGPLHVNAYVEALDEGQPPFPIYASSGIDLFSTVASGGACRGMIETTSLLYAISGAVLVSVDPGGTSTVIGGIPGTGKAIMAVNAANPQQIAIVVEGQGYFVESGVLTQLIDPDLPPPNSCTFLDSRVIYGIDDGRFFWSDIDDLSAIDALSFATAEGSPDNLVRAFAHKLDLWLFGKRTIEMWRSTGNADDPFQRAGGGIMARGCGARHSVATLGDTILWVGDDFIPYKADGYVPQSLLHGPVVRDIEDLADKEDLTGFTFYDSGYGFYVLTCEDWTWQYNLTTGKWFNRQSYNLDNWRVLYASPFQNSTILGDTSSAILYRLNRDTFDENGDNLVWTVRSAPMHTYPNRISVDRLYADFITGVGLNSGDDHADDPQVGLRWSDDGGRTFSRQIFKDLGVQGDYETRVVWNNLGTTGRQGRIWELQVSSPVIRGLRYAAIEGDKVGT